MGTTYEGPNYKAPTQLYNTTLIVMLSCLCFTSPSFANENVSKHLKNKRKGNLFGLDFHSYQDLMEAEPGTAAP